MAFTVTFFNTNKKLNSTFVPTVNNSPYITMDVTFKNGESMLQPTLLVEYNSNIIVNYNYVYILAFQRFYFIRDWRSINNNIWECSCLIDVLATYKTELGAQSHYILRAYSDYNPFIMDNQYIAKARSYKEVVNITSNFATDFFYGTYVLGIINGENTSGSITYYAIQQPEMGALKSWMMDDPENYTSTPWDVDVSADTIKYLFNPYQYIASIEWFPFGIGTFTGTNTTIKFGWWDTGITGKRISSYAINYTIGTATIKRHPDYQTRGEFLLYPPFTSYKMYFPPIGDVELNGEMCANLLINASADTASFNINASVDVMSGIAYIRCLDQTYNTDLQIFNSTVKISVPVNIASVLSNSTLGDTQQYKISIGTVSNVAKDVGGLITSAATKNVAGSVSNFINLASDLAMARPNLREGAYDALAARSPHVDSFGINGGITAFSIQPYITLVYEELTDENNTEFGRPLYEVKQINQLSGFIQCAGAEPVIRGATFTELISLRNIINKGFFYE